MLPLANFIGEPEINMSRGLIYAGAAALTTFLALFAATHILSVIPDSAARAALNRESEEADTLSEQERIRSALSKQLRKQEDEIAALRRKLDAAHAELAAKKKPSGVTVAHSDNVTNGNSDEDASQREIQHLNAQLAQAAQDAATREQKIQTLQSEVARLDEELQQKDGSLSALVSKLTAIESSKGTMAGPAKPTEAANAERDPVAAANRADKQPSLSRGDTSRSATTAHATVSDGVAAYQDGRYQDAFEIWNALAHENNAHAQFHLGALYYEGRGVAANLDKARTLLRQALAGGDKRAAGLLGLLNDPVPTSNRANHS